MFCYISKSEQVKSSLETTLYFLMYQSLCSTMWSLYSMQYMKYGFKMSYKMSYITFISASIQ